MDRCGSNRCAGSSRQWAAATSSCRASGSSNSWAETTRAVFDQVESETALVSWFVAFSTANREYTSPENALAADIAPFARLIVAEADGSQPLGERGYLIELRSADDLASAVDVTVFAGVLVANSDRCHPIGK